MKTLLELFLVDVVHVDGPYQINCDGQVGESFVWNDFGLKLTFPPKCVQRNIEIAISALLPIKTKVRPGVYLVSTIFKFHCNVKKFDKAFTLSLQHCVNLQSVEDCHRMCFIVQHSNTSDIKHGQFEVQGSYGSIALNAFCCISIAWMTEIWKNVNLQMMVIPLSETPDDQSNSQAISNPSSRRFQEN